MSGFGIQNLQNPTNLTDAVNLYALQNILSNKNIFNGDGTKVLCSDGVFRLTPLPSSITYTGSLSGINAKILMIANDSFTPSIMLSNINTVITALGGTIGTYSGTTGIYVNIIALGSTDISVGLTTGSGGYDSNYDCILYWDNNNPASDTVSVLNTWYNSGKGVILSTFADTNAIATFSGLSKVITNYTSSYTVNPTSYSQSSTFSILLGVSSIAPWYCGSSFGVINGGTGIGSINGSNAVNYYNPNDGVHGRRVDLNWFLPLSIGGNGGGTDSSTSGTTRATIQACLWSCGRFNN